MAPLLSLATIWLAVLMLHLRRDTGLMHLLLPGDGALCPQDCEAACLPDTSGLAKAMFTASVLMQAALLAHFHRAVYIHDPSDNFM